jgi:SET domain-containing protein
MSTTEINHDVEMRPSKIHGTGLFARRAFKAGEIVLRWKLDVRIQANELPSLPIAEHKYLHPLAEDTFVILQPPERFVNHSCINNTRARDFADVAIREIECGEEITSDYSSDGASRTFSCSCGAETCRGTINPT